MPDLNKQNETKQAVVQNSDASTDALRRAAADAVQQGGQAAHEATNRGTAIAADVAREGTQAGAEAMRRVGGAAAETMRRGTAAVAEGQRQIAEDAARRFQETSRKVADVAQGTSDRMKGLFTLPNAAEGGLQDMQQSVAGLVEGVVQTNLRAMQEVLRLTDPGAIIELQQRFVRDYLDTLMQGTASLIHAVRRTADETLRPLEQQVSERKEQERRQHAHAAE